MDARYERWLGPEHIRVKDKIVSSTAEPETTLAAVTGANRISLRPELDFGFRQTVHLRASYLYRWQKGAKEQGVWVRLAIGG